MAGAHDTGDSGLYSSPHVWIEVRSGEGTLFLVAHANASLVTDAPVAPWRRAGDRHRLSCGTHTLIRARLKIPANVGRTGPHGSLTLFGNFELNSHAAERQRNLFQKL